MSHSDKNKLKTWCLCVVVFCIWAAGFDFLWTHVIINGSGTSEAARIHHLIKENGSEIPVFGASQAHSDFVPQILGDDVFNYGMYSASLDVVNALLQIECKKNKTTPIVVVLNHTAFHGIGDPSKFAPFAYRPEIREMLERTGLMQWRYWVPGIRYFGYYDWFLKDYLAEHMSVTKKTVRGYTVELNAVPISLDEAIKKRLETGFGFLSFADQDAILFDTIRQTPRRTFIIVYAPMHPSCFVNFTDPEGFARYLDKLKSFPNVVVVDMGRMELPEDCYHDTVHLNPKGAEEFSRRFAVKLQAIRAATNPVAHSP